MNGKPWTMPELKIVIKYRNSGIYGKEGWRKRCSQETGRSIASIGNAVSRFLEPKGPAKMYDEWSQEDCDDLLVMKAHGMSWRDIGQVLDRTAAACARKWRYIR